MLAPVLGVSFCLHYLTGLHLLLVVVEPEVVRQQGRERDCTSPAPGPGGSDCTGAESESRNCQIKECKIDVDGKWGKWGSYGACSVPDCGGGTKTRSRYIQTYNRFFPSIRGGMQWRHFTCLELLHRENISTL